MSGLSETRLGCMHDIMAGYVGRTGIPGLVTLVSRHGETHVDAIGVQDLGTAVPMQHDSIFRIASMTKPIVAVAAMILVEETRLRLDDPVDDRLPELADRRVLRGIDSALDDTVPANRSITLRDLLTFRPGFGAIMDAPDHCPIQTAMSDAGLAPGPMPSTLPPNEWLRRLGALPLVHQPGERWMYHTGSDVLGVLVARASGMSLEAFLQERIFGPLGMSDTAFSVAESNLDRLATCYETDGEHGGLKVVDEARGGAWSHPPAFQSGGGGLVSTVEDYLAFSKMLLNGGSLGSERILARPTVELMTNDHISPEQKSASPFFPGFWDSTGWGFGMSVVTRRDGIGPTPGSVGWAGGFGTWWSCDRAEEMVTILMTQRQMSGTNPDADFMTLAYAAIDD